MVDQTTLIAIQEYHLPDATGTASVNERRSSEADEPDLGRVN